MWSRLVRSDWLSYPLGSRYWINSPTYFLVDCNCDTDGSNDCENGLCPCDNTGQCSCINDNIDGLLCDACIVGYTNFPDCDECDTDYYNKDNNQPPTCEPCSCDSDGSTDSECLDGSGQCTCKNDEYVLHIYN